MDRISGLSGVGVGEAGNGPLLCVGGVCVGCGVLVTECL